MNAHFVWFRAHMPRRMTSAPSRRPPNRGRFSFPIFFHHSKSTHHVGNTLYWGFREIGCRLETHGELTLHLDLMSSSRTLGTTELVEFAKRKPEFDALGTRLIGVSIDSIRTWLGWE